MEHEKVTISEAELEIMKVLWKTGGPTNTQTINNAVSHKAWKRTTISTLLTRLVQKGAISSEKQGNLYYYTPLVSVKKYRKSQVKSLIKNLYNGSIKELAVSLFEDDTLSEDDLKELKDIFKN